MKNLYLFMILHFFAIPYNYCPQPLHRKFSQYQEMKNDPEVKKIINCALGVKETRDLSKKQQENQLRLLEQCTVYKETKEIVAKEFKENPKRLKAITVEFLERHA
ncbi:MAG: hypothetical protein CL947_02750 [Epsilonproteobacteria bacterium]|nr:hypothetical protein [Campylobacterota bacterium]|tara:strand:+ start:107 stop:421 length:315 start_codon:yes stop_codon:yes gene_type:complete